MAAILLDLPLGRREKRWIPDTLVEKGVYRVIVWHRPCLTLAQADGWCPERQREIRWEADARPTGELEDGLEIWRVE